MYFDHLSPLYSMLPFPNSKQCLILFCVSCWELNLMYARQTLSHSACFCFIVTQASPYAHMYIHTTHAHSYINGGPIHEIKPTADA